MEDAAGLRFVVLGLHAVLDGVSQVTHEIWGHAGALVLLDQGPFHLPQLS
ncbi:hypothetical protein [Rhodoferax koreensis]|nr:hypothetical protein [Rhodoferax koreense]